MRCVRERKKVTERKRDGLMLRVVLKLISPRGRGGLAERKLYVSLKMHMMHFPHQQLLSYSLDQMISQSKPWKQVFGILQPQLMIYYTHTVYIKYVQTFPVFYIFFYYSINTIETKWNILLFSFVFCAGFKQILK